MTAPARREWLLFSLLFLGGALFHQPAEYDNTKSRLILLSSIVDQGSLSIDAQQSYTVDKSYAGGHYYSNKAIGAPLIAVPVYWLLRHTVLKPVTSLADPTILADPAAKYLVRLITTTLPFAVLGIVMLRLLLRWGAAPRAAVWTVLAYGFGTIALNHATVFSGHELAACLAFFAFASRGFSAGLFAGLAALCDYPSALLAPILRFVLAARHERRSERAGFYLALGLCASVLALYNLACFGGIFDLSYSGRFFGAFAPGVSKGIFGVSWPDPKALFFLLASPSRGLLFIMPVLLYSLAGTARLWSQKTHRAELLCVLAFAAGNLLLISGFYGWHGGWTFGPRYLVPMLPFLVLPIAFAFDGSLLFYGLFSISVIQVGLAQAGIPHVPEDIRNPLVEFVVPLMGYGYFSSNAGTLLGLSGALSAALCAGVLALLGALTVRSFPRSEEKTRLGSGWRAGMALWAGAVLLGLVFIRTLPERKVHHARAIVLYDGVRALGLEELKAAEKVEEESAGGL